jgi:LysM repeat protein
MARRKPSRYLAPIVLVGLVLGVYLIVHHGLAAHPKSRTAAHGSAHAGRRGARTPRFYVVRAGDILGDISSRTGIPLARLEELNPNLDPNSLRSGQRIRLRP